MLTPCDSSGSKRSSGGSAIGDAILRLPVDSKGADNDVKLAHERGIPVYYGLEEIPVYQAPG
jgi:hypothetical protein